MAAGNAHAKAGVGAQVGAVAEYVTDGDHAPVAATAGAKALFIEAAGDQADSDAFLEVEPEYVANDDRLFRHEFQATALADLVAIGRSSENLAADGLAA